MKKEDLIKRLEDAEPPSADLPGYKNRLKMALLDTGHLHERQRGFTILELAKSKIKGVKDTMIRGLVSRQPVWKTATVSLFALALVLGLSLAIPPLNTDSVYAQAAEIAQNSPEVREILGANGEIQVVKVVNVVDDKGTVIAQGEMGVAAVEVDLSTNQVTEVDILMELTEEGEQQAIDIVRADPGVKELLDAGATIG